MVKLVYQNTARIRSYSGEKIEFQLAFQGLKLASGQFNQGRPGTGHDHRVAAIRQRWAHTMVGVALRIADARVPSLTLTCALHLPLTYALL